MSKTNEEKAEQLLGKLIEVVGQLNSLEKTFSRLKDESEELIRKMLKRNGQNQG